jgi:hypothetical protein
MTAEQFERFHAGVLLRQELGMTGDTLYIEEWRRDKQTGLVLHAIFFAETLLTLAKASGR